MISLFFPPHYHAQVGNCVYEFDTTKNYVIHILWVILVSGALLVAGVSFVHFYRRLRATRQSRR